MSEFMLNNKVLQRFQTQFDKINEKNRKLVKKKFNFYINLQRCNYKLFG